jgi:hypothetical protein
MTIREYCAHRSRLARKIAILVGVSWMLGWSAFQVLAKMTINSWYVAGTAALLIACVMNVVLQRTKCPRCGFSLRKVVAQAASSTLPRVDACPHCGVSLDEPTEHPAPGDAKS